MSQSAPTDKDSLASHNIFRKRRDDVPSSPSMLQTLLKLVVDVKEIKSDQFRDFATNKSAAKSYYNVPQELSTRQKYENELLGEADRLCAACNEYHAEDYSEAAWMNALQPIVFYRFDRTQEDTFSRRRHHHCFVCRKHYPFGSRPLLNSRSSKILSNDEEFLGKDRISDLCKLSSQRHFNLPNFCMINQLAYPKTKNAAKKIPDLTIGLLTYDLKQLDQEIIKNERIAPFDQQLLRKLRVNERLYLPVSFTQGKQRRIKEPDLTFPFAIWEAKREGGGYDHLHASVQNSRRVKELLLFQDNVSREAEISWTPLVWMFVSVGSKWEIYGCYLEEHSQKTKNPICYLNLLWVGDSANDDDALQLLYIVDIIALWGEHCYKPFTGACIRRLQADLDGGKRPEQANLLVHQLIIDEKTFPWLFEERDAAYRTLPRHTYQKSYSQVLQEPSEKKGRRNSQNRFNSQTIRGEAVQRKFLPWKTTSASQSGPYENSDIARQPSLDSSKNSECASVASLNLPSDSYTPSDESSDDSGETSAASDTSSESDRSSSLDHSSPSNMPPDRDRYIWLVDRAKKDANLLVIRIDARGNIFKPLLLFGGDNWGNRQFESLVRKERNTKPECLLTDFTTNQRGNSYIHNCIVGSPIYFRAPQLQFCAIVPLVSESYRGQVRRSGEGIFTHLEAKLDLLGLLKAAERANERICECQSKGDEDSPGTISCDNLKCPIGRYHFECQDLPKNFRRRKFWLCKKCSQNQKDVEFAHTEAKKDSKGDDCELDEDSDFRIRRARTFAQAWENHKWPEREKVRALFRNINRQIEIDEDDTYRTVAEVKKKENKESRFWAILKSDPKTMMPLESVVGDKPRK